MKLWREIELGKLNVTDYLKLEEPKSEDVNGNIIKTESDTFKYEVAIRYEDITQKNNLIGHFFVETTNENATVEELRLLVIEYIKENVLGGT